MAPSRDGSLIVSPVYSRMTFEIQKDYVPITVPWNDVPVFMEIDHSATRVHQVIYSDDHRKIRLDSGEAVTFRRIVLHAP